jgi:membrane-associated phospholipid phosphatase
MQNDLLALAARIARNREIAGVHYPSDSKAGADLAAQAVPLLRQPLPPLSPGSPNPAKSWYQQVFEAAQAEW